MNSLKFDKVLVPLVINKSKNTTWRLFDDKNLNVGEIIELIKRPELTVFAKAKIISINKTAMGKLTNKDKQGHETFTSDEEMYKTYSGYYNKEVNNETPVTIYKFEVLELV